VYVCHLVSVGVSSEQTHCVIFISPVVNYCHYACGNTTVTVRSIQVMYWYSPSLHTIYNYNPSALIILILPNNVIDVQQKQKDRHPNRPCHCTVTLHSASEEELKYRLCE